MAFELSTLALKQDVTEIQLVHPSTQLPLWADEEETKPVSIFVYGKATKHYRNTLLAIQNKQFKGKSKLDAALLQEQSTDLLVAVSEKAINLELDGKAIDTPEAFRKLYSDLRFDWIRQQVDEAVGDVANFIK